MAASRQDMEEPCAQGTVFLFPESKPCCCPGLTRTELEKQPRRSGMPPGDPRARPKRASTPIMQRCVRSGARMPSAWPPAPKKTFENSRCNGSRKLVRRRRHRRRYNFRQFLAGCATQSVRCRWPVRTCFHWRRARRRLGHFRSSHCNSSAFRCQVESPLRCVRSFLDALLRLQTFPRGT